MGNFALIRQVRMEVTSLIKAADKWIFSVYDSGRHEWLEFGPYEYSEAKRNRKDIFLQKIRGRLRDSQQD